MDSDQKVHAAELDQFMCKVSLKANQTTGKFLCNND